MSFWVKKNLFLGQKVWKFWKKFGKKFGKSSESLETGFSKCSEISENYEKMMLNSNFGKREKLVPTRKLTQKFG